MSFKRFSQLFALALAVYALDICRPQYAFGARSCTGIHRELGPLPLSNSDQTQIRFTPETPNEVKSEIIALVSEIHKIFPNLVPRELVISGNPNLPSTESIYTPWNKRLNIGLKERMTTGIFPGATFVHEFFHPVSESFIVVSLRGLSDSLKGFREKIKKIQMHETLKAGSQKIVEERAALEAEEREISIAGASKEERDLLRDKWGAFNEKRDAFREKLKPIGKIESEMAEISKMTLPYEELHSDFAAALFYNDGKIISESLNNPETQLFENEANGPRPRDFTQTTNFRNWNPKSMTYGLFDPARGAIWNFVSKRLLAEMPPENILKAFINAANIQIARRLTSSDSKSPTQLNQEFFRLFVEQSRLAKKDGLEVP